MKFVGTTRYSLHMGIFSAPSVGMSQSVVKGCPLNKVGIFAGSFDPIHNGHLAFAELALENGVDKVFFLVEPRPRRKQGVRALEHRQEMVRLATKNNSKLGVIHLDHAKFTAFDTLPLLQARFKNQELVLLFGDDVISHMVDHLSDWPHIEDIAKHTSLLIAAPSAHQAALADRLKAVMEFGVKFRFQFVMPSLAVRSSQIRHVLKTGKATTDVPQATLDYIKRFSIYASFISTK